MNKMLSQLTDISGFAPWPTIKEHFRRFWVQKYTLFQNGRHLDILLFLFKLDLDASFKAKYSFEFSAQERGIKG